MSIDCLLFHVLEAYMPKSSYALLYVIDESGIFHCVIVVCADNSVVCCKDIVRYIKYLVRICQYTCDEVNLPRIIAHQHYH